MNRLVEDAVFATRQIETFLFGKYERKIPIQLFMESEGMLESIASTTQVERESLRTVVQDLEKRLIDEDIASYQWILTDSMCAGALTKEMEIHDDMRSFLTEGVFELQDHGINKVQCVDREIRMLKIRNREKIEVKPPNHTDILA